MGRRRGPETADIHDFKDELTKKYDALLESEGLEADVSTLDDLERQKQELKKPEEGKEDRAAWLQNRETEKMAEAMQRYDKYLDQGSALESARTYLRDLAGQSDHDTQFRSGRHDDFALALSEAYNIPLEQARAMVYEEMDAENDGSYNLKSRKHGRAA